MQRGVVGDLAAMRELADEVAALGVLERAAELCVHARHAGVRVVHATAELRADRAGLSINNPMMAHVVKNPGQVLQGLRRPTCARSSVPAPEDIVCRRIHGLTPFTGTELDAILRNLGVRNPRPRRRLGQRGAARALPLGGRSRLPHRVADRLRGRRPPVLRRRRRQVLPRLHLQPDERRGDLEGLVGGGWRDRG